MMASIGTRVPDNLGGERERDRGRVLFNASGGSNVKFRLEGDSALLFRR